MERFSYGRFAGDASQRVHSIVSAAEAEAAGLIRDAEREAELIRREARAESERILDEARARGDALVTERAERIAELSDGILEQTEMLTDRMDSAGQVRRQLEGLLRSLGEAAANVSRELSSRRTPVRQPTPRAEPLPPRSEPLPPPSRSIPEPVRPARPEPVQRAPEPVRRAPEPPARIADHRSDRRPAEDPGDARFDGARLVALQMAVAGSTREEVADELRRAFRLSDPSPILDDVFGSRRAGAAS